MIAPASLSDAAECARITMTHARTFSLASKLLPLDKRRAAYGLYAFCRVADDLVDQADHDNLGELRIQLDGYREQLRSALDGRPAGTDFP
ncbi:MAG: squalene/phytoene synthase family protein [Gemmatimonas sp.]